MTPAERKKYEAAKKALRDRDASKKKPKKKLPKMTKDHERSLLRQIMQ